jgi:hypothetical protein
MNARVYVNLLEGILNKPIEFWNMGYRLVFFCVSASWKMRG